MSKEINWVSMQALIGGFSLGAEKAFGTPPKMIIHQGWANDKHYIKYMNDVRNLNIPIVEMNSDYVTFKTLEDEKIFNDVLQKYTIDVTIMTPICSGLSQMNSSNTGSMARGCADNDQNQNMYALTRLGMRMNAKVVVFENAPAAYTKSGEKTVDKLKEIAEEYNFSTHLIKTDTLLHGIPQSRKRTFLSFYNSSNPPLFEFESLPRTSIKEYFKGIPSDATHYTDYIHTPEGALGHLYEYVLNSTNTTSLLEAITSIDPENKKSTWTVAQMTEVLGWDNAIEYFNNKVKENPDDKELLKVKSNVEHYKKKREAGLSFWDNSTILANRGEFVNAIVGKSLTSMVNPIEERAYTIREMMFLMGMPHDFYLENFKSNWNHICQNVPVKTSSYIATQINKFLNGTLEISKESFVKQDNIKQKTDLG